MKRLLSVALLVAAGCASTGSDNEPLPPVPQADARELAALQKRVEELNTSMTELLDRIDVLNQRIAGYEQAAAAQARPLAAPVPDAAAPAGAVPAPVPRAAPEITRREAASTPTSQPLISAQIADRYRTALMLYGQGKMDQARAVFDEVYQADRAGELADNALYWIGETWFAAGKYSEAMKFYRRVTSEYSESNKASDALFKTALSFEKLGDLGVAKSTLDEVISRYPYSAAAASAKLELRRIRY